MKNSDMGLIGLGGMGQMLSLNLERNCFRVAGYDIDPDKCTEFLLKAAGRNSLTCSTVSEFIDILDKPHRILMMVP